MGTTGISKNGAFCIGLVWIHEQHCKVEPNHPFSGDGVMEDKVLIIICMDVDTCEVVVLASGIAGSGPVVGVGEGVGVKASIGTKLPLLVVVDVVVAVAHLGVQW